MYTDLAIWVTLLTRLFLDLRENTSSKEQGLISTYMDMCLLLCVDPLEGLPSLAGMVRGPHKVGLPESKPTGSHLLINHSLCWNPMGTLS